MSDIWKTPGWMNQSCIIARSFHHWLGRPLLENLPTDLMAQAEQLYHADWVIVSHNSADDPCLNYANQLALQLWEATPEQLIGMPSRLTAEPMHRDERARMLAQTSEKGYFDRYQGIRISTKGKRFLIENAIVWNLLHPDGSPAGQAAAFHQWSPVHE